MSGVRKPKSIESVYRALLAVRGDLQSMDVRMQLRIDITEARYLETIEKLAHHCHRLLREKETLQRRCALYEANRFMAASIVEK